MHGHELHRYLRELRPLLGQPHFEKVQPLAERLHGDLGSAVLANHFNLLRQLHKLLVGNSVAVCRRGADTMDTHSRSLPLGVYMRALASASLACRRLHELWRSGCSAQAAPEAN